MTRCVNALRMPLVLSSAGGACPDVLVVYCVAVLGGDLDVAVGKSGRDFRRPGLEFAAVGVVFDAGDHEGGEVAEFVGEDVEETVGVIDDFGGELDGGVVVDDNAGVG